MTAGVKIGVLALQGDVREHLRALRGAGVEGAAVKSRAELESVDGLIIPGGESTTVGRLLERFHLIEPLRASAAEGMPMWGTCMGMVLMAREVVGQQQPLLGVMDITVRRNASGRQVDSREVDLEVPVLGPEPFPAVFIRAPFAESWGRDVQCLASYQGEGVLLRQGHLLASSFHPELTDDDRLHRYFVEMAA